MPHLASLLRPSFGFGAALRPRRPLLPSRLRFALLVMLGAYPLVAVLQLIIGPWVSTWPGVMRPLPIVPFMVFGMVYGVIPSIHRFAGGWIARGSHEAS